MRIVQGVRIQSISNATNYISREFHSYLKTEEMKRARGQTAAHTRERAHIYLVILLAVLRGK